MANIHEHNESCKAHMRDLIKKGLNNKIEPNELRRQTVKECKKLYIGVDDDTFYRWYKSVINEQEIILWESDCKIEIKDKLEDRRNLKELIYQRNKKIYEDNEDPVEVKNAEKTLLTYFLNSLK